MRDMASISESEISQSICCRGGARTASLEPLGPTRLHYTLHTRKRKIAQFWVLLLIDCCIIPVALFYSLHFSTHLSNATVFSITTAMTGGTLIIQFFVRGYHLWKWDSSCRVKGAPRAYFDWTHWILLVAIVVAVTELVVGNAYPKPIVRLLAMPVPSFLFVFATETMIRDFLHIFRWKAPVRISSCPKGVEFRPGIYSIVEDIVATDGGGKTEYRERFDKRYRSSYRFRHMIRMLSLFWGFGGVTTALGTSALVWTLEQNIAYGIGWVVPFMWGFIWTLCTIWWIPGCLEVEYATWEDVRSEAIP